MHIFYSQVKQYVKVTQRFTQMSPLLTQMSSEIKIRVNTPPIVHSLTQTSIKTTFTYILCPKEGKLFLPLTYSRPFCGGQNLPLYDQRNFHSNSNPKCLLGDLSAPCQMKLTQKFAQLEKIESKAGEGPSCTDSISQNLHTFNNSK